VRRNQHPGNCRRCGQWCEKDQGFLLTERDPDTHGVVHHVEHERCPEATERRTRTVAPLWAVYCDGRTPDGNQAHGISLSEGERPDDAYPANDAARALDRGES